MAPRTAPNNKGPFRFEQAVAAKANRVNNANVANTWPPPLLSEVGAGFGLERSVTSMQPQLRHRCSIGIER
jgi:hypothetical protein